VAFKLLIQATVPIIDFGAVARVILGSVLGLGLAYATDTRDYGGIPRTALIAGEARNAYLSIGLVILLLAVVAPHVDDWLSHAGGLKAGILEIQLSNVASRHHEILPDVRSEFVDKNVLNILKKYGDRIEEDKQIIVDLVGYGLKSQPHQTQTIKGEIGKNEDIALLSCRQKPAKLYCRHETPAIAHFSMRLAHKRLGNVEGGILRCASSRPISTSESRRSTKR